MMSEVPTLLVSLVFAVLAVWFRLTPEDRMKGSQSVSPEQVGQSVSRPERIARRFHEVYEELAPIYGWETQNRSAVEWDALPPENKRLMIKTVTRLIHEGVFDGRRYVVEADARV